jgi:hypothetical protein
MLVNLREVIQWTRPRWNADEAADQLLRKITKANIRRTANGVPNSDEYMTRSAVDSRADVLLLNRICSGTSGHGEEGKKYPILQTVSRLIDGRFLAYRR